MDGPVVSFATVLNGLSENFVIFPALILSGRKPAELVLRKYGLKARVVAVAVDLLWNFVRPTGIHRAFVAICVSLALLASCLRLALAFDALGDLSLDQGLDLARLGLGPVIALPDLGLVLAVAAQVFLAPARQLGSLDVVARNQSPWRFKMLAWVAVELSATTVLLAPSFGSSFAFVMLVTASPLVLILVTLLLPGSRAEDTKEKKQKEKGAGAGPSMAPEEAALQRVPLVPTMGFLAMACGVGTTGEALNDMAVDLSVREALSQGDTTLALAYNGSVLLAMISAYIVETRPFAGTKAAADSEDRGHTDPTPRRGLFILLWAACQVFRTAILPSLKAGASSGPTLGTLGLVAFIVLLDKFAGPLGGAAFDTALLSLLSRSRSAGAGGGWSVPSGLLWTVRTAVERLERPICQLLLLHGGASYPWLAPLLASATAAFVVTTLRSTQALGGKDSGQHVRHKMSQWSKESAPGHTKKLN